MAATRLPLRWTDARAAQALTNAEQAVFDYLAQDFTVLRNGWPDFLCVGDTSGEVVAIEVKAGRDTLRPSQRDMIWYLQEAGITTLLVYIENGRPVVWPTPAGHWDAQLRAAALTRAERATIGELLATPPRR